MFYHSPGYQNISILVPWITPKTTKVTNIPIYLYTYMPRAHLSHQCTSPVLQPSHQICNSSPRARASGVTGWFSPLWLGTTKSPVLAPRYPNPQISLNHTIYYTLATFYHSPGYPNVSILVPWITPKTTKVTNTPLYLYTYIPRAHLSHHYTNIPRYPLTPLGRRQCFAHQSAAPRRGAKACLRHVCNVLQV